MLTGKPSVDRPWMKYYPKEISQMQIPDCTVYEYLKMNCPGDDIVAMEYYGANVKWETVFSMTEQVMRSLCVLGLHEGDQLPVFLRLVPEYVFLLLAAEKIGASLLCRDNTLEENAEAVKKADAKIIFAHDFLSQEELDAYVACGVEKVILLDPCYVCGRTYMPQHIENTLDSLYPDRKAVGPEIILWEDFLELGKAYTGSIDTPADTGRPLLRAYTSGATGPSKQVIHSASTMIGVVHQMNFYAASDKFRPTWLVTILPPSLVAVVVCMVLMPLASNKLLMMDPFCEVEDLDLEIMRYKPNSWPEVPMFLESLIQSKRIPDDYDMSHLMSAGPGCESFNNTQVKRTQQFLAEHNCNIRVTIGYGCSEAGANTTLPMTPHPVENGNVGIPLPLSVISIFKPGTEEEVGYNTPGEICISGPGVMLGYDNLQATQKAIRVHSDGRRWLHMGDIGYMNEDGVIYPQTRGKAPRFGGGDLATLPMENLVADAAIEGIEDEFFVIMPDKGHPGYFEPYFFVVLKDGYTVQDIRQQVEDCLEDYMIPVEIYTLDKRPFFHFKTDRIGLSRNIERERILA